MRALRKLRSAHRRRSVRTLSIGAVVSAAGGAWAAVPGAWVDRLPTWAVLLVPALIFITGVACAGSED